MFNVIFCLMLLVFQSCSKSSGNEQITSSEGVHPLFMITRSKFSPSSGIGSLYTLSDLDAACSSAFGSSYIAGTDYDLLKVSPNFGLTSLKLQVWSIGPDEMRPAYVSNTSGRWILYASAIDNYPLLCIYKS